MYNFIHSFHPDCSFIITVICSVNFQQFCPIAFSRSTGIFSKYFSCYLVLFLTISLLCCCDPFNKTQLFDKKLHFSTFSSLNYLHVQGISMLLPSSKWKDWSSSTKYELVWNISNMAKKYSTIIVELGVFLPQI